MSPQQPSFPIARLIEASPDAILVVDEDGIVVQANTQVEAMFGYPLDVLVGASIDRLVPGDVRSRHHQHRAEFGSSPRTRPMAAGLQLSAQRADGTLLPVDIALAPLDSNGRRYTAAFVRDATHRREQELQRQQLREAALARNQALEVNDNIVQGLSSAVWLLDMGSVDQAEAELKRTLAAARLLLTNLLGGDLATVEPGQLIRSEQAPGGTVTVDELPPRATVAETGLRVVVADDADDVRLLLNLQLSSAGINVVAEAINGREAIDAVATHLPDAILLDLSMPELDGLQATAVLREHHPSLRIIVLSGHPAAIMRDAAIGAGADLFLEKGDGFDRVVGAVTGAITV